MKSANVSFATWVKTYGAGKLSKELNVSESTIRHWAGGRRLPRAEAMRMIFILSRNRVSAEQMLDAHISWRARK